MPGPSTYLYLRNILKVAHAYLHKHISFDILGLGKRINMSIYYEVSDTFKFTRNTTKHNTLLNLYLR